MSKRDALKRFNQSLDGMDPILSSPEEESVKKETEEKKEVSKEVKVKKPVVRKKVTADVEKVAIPVCLPEKLSVYLTIKANRSGKTIQDFFELLIREDAKKIDKINPFDSSLRKYQNQKSQNEFLIRRTIYVSEEIRDLIKDSASKLGMKTGSYTYYVVEKKRLSDKECPDFD